MLCLVELGYLIHNPSLFPPFHATHHHASWILIDLSYVSQPSTYHLSLTIKNFNPMVYNLYYALEKYWCIKIFCFSKSNNSHLFPIYNGKNWLSDHSLNKIFLMDFFKPSFCYHLTMLEFCFIGYWICTKHITIFSLL